MQVNIRSFSEKLHCAIISGQAFIRINMNPKLAPPHPKIFKNQIFKNHQNMILWVKVIWGEPHQMPMKHKGQNTRVHYAENYRIQV